MDPNTTPTAPAAAPSPNDKILKHFTHTHLPASLALVSRPFCELAHAIVATLRPGPERSVALRKLLEAKDAAVRAAKYPGG